MKNEINEGMIKIDTEPAKLLGFTSDKFRPYSYLWWDGDRIIISFIASKQKGAFRELIEKILQNGFDFEIPTPNRRMREIGAKQGWLNCLMDFGEFDFVEVLTNTPERCMDIKSFDKWNEAVDLALKTTEMIATGRQ